MRWRSSERSAVPGSASARRRSRRCSAFSSSPRPARTLQQRCRRRPQIGEQEVRGHAWVKTRFRSCAGIRHHEVGLVVSATSRRRGRFRCRRRGCSSCIAAAGKWVMTGAGVSIRRDARTLSTRRGSDSLVARRPIAVRLASARSVSCRPALCSDAGAVHGAPRIEPTARQQVTAVSGP
jgi:hypothetical protein